MLRNSLTRRVVPDESKRADAKAPCRPGDAAEAQTDAVAPTLSRPRMPGEPLVVVLGFPLTPTPALLGKVTAVSSRVEVISCPYERRGTVVDLTLEQRAAFARADVMLAYHLPPDVPSVAPRLRWVQAVAAGVDRFADCGLAGRVTVTNGAGIAAVHIAEFCIARLLAIWKCFDDLADLQARREWTPTYGRSFSGSTVGVVGLGAIGRAVAERAHAMGAHVIGVRRNVQLGGFAFVEAIYAPEQLHEMLGQCDAVVLSAPSTATTAHLFDAAAFAAMKPGAVFCNVARGALVDEVALLDALHSGHLGAAALDVTKQEPIPSDSPLWHAPRLQLSPHSAGALEGYIDNLFDLFADNLSRYLRREPLRNLVDLQAGY